MKLLNLGAGNRLITECNEGDTVINHDIVAHRPEINAVWDLNVTPWIWRDNEFDRIEFISTIEHLVINPIQALNECHRVLKAGGILTLKYPVVTSETIWDDPTHTRYLTARSIEYVCPDLPYGKVYNFYTDKKWKLLDGGVIKNRNYKCRMTPIK